jgi:hypothetical protein
VLKCKLPFTSQVGSSHTLIRKGFSFFMGRDSVVIIVTRYGLDGTGIESQLGREFPLPYRSALGPNQPPIQWAPDIARGK